MKREHKHTRPVQFGSTLHLDFLKIYPNCLYLVNKLTSNMINFNIKPPFQLETFQIKGEREKVRGRRREGKRKKHKKAFFLSGKSNWGG